MPNDMRYRMIELISDIENELLRSYPYTTNEYRIASIADHLIENGAILPPCKPMPIVMPLNATDAFCPYCGENLSGCYGEEPPNIIMCCGCGKWLDNTKAITREDAVKALREREGE